MQQFLLGSLALATLVAGSPINCPATHQKITDLVGNGDPHQNFIFKQISATTDCNGNPSGGAAITNGTTVSWGFSISGAADFITGGFDVSQSVSTSSTNSFGCTTGPDQVVNGDLCVFERITTTAYTVNQRTCTQSCSYYGCSPYEPNVVIYAPNSYQPGCFYDNVQTGFPCSGVGTEHVVTAGPAGGPQSVSCQPMWNS